MANAAVGKIKCQFCDAEADIRRAKTGKPYIMCDECGTQVFARGDAAVASLEAKISGAGPALAPGPLPGRKEDIVPGVEGERTKPWFSL